MIMHASCHTALLNRNSIRHAQHHRQGSCNVVIWQYCCTDTCNKEQIWAQPAPYTENSIQLLLLHYKAAAVNATNQQQTKMLPGKTPTMAPAVVSDKG